MTGNELDFIRTAHESGRLSGNGDFTKKCEVRLERQIGCVKSLLTHSCTAALEMAAILAGITQGDEIVMPSYTFVSTANAFVMHGGVPVFVDIRQDTLNIDETRIEAAITDRTRAIVVVHYAGVSCEMDTILAIAKKHNLLVIEDAAQGIEACYKGEHLGSFGELATLSFHETKNIISGEGGALLINDASLYDRAEIIREKGTNRKQFVRGQVDKYTWTDIGSSFLPGELIAAFLWAQLEQVSQITQRRLQIWDVYHEAFAELEERGLIRRPLIPRDCAHNAHMYYLLLPDLGQRTRFIKRMADEGIQCVFHYVPLHSSPKGLEVGRAIGDMRITDELSSRLVRLPFWLGVEPHLERIISSTKSILEEDA